MYNMNMPYFTPNNFSKSRKIYTSNYYNSKTNNNMNQKNKTLNSNFQINQEEKENSSKILLNESPKNKSDKDDVLFEIMGLKIYFDDILIICILLFLYQEGIQDEYLFIALILLLLN